MEAALTKKSRMEKDFDLIVEAALKGERCPKTYPHGPIMTGSIGKLYTLGFIRSEVYAGNFRVIKILWGTHKGKSTAPPPKGGKPYRVNGRDARRGLHPI